MTHVRIIEAPAFSIAGKSTWIDGPDNQSFGRFWERCREDGLLRQLENLRTRSGLTTNTTLDRALLGVSCVEKDPNNRSFDYWIAAACVLGFSIDRASITAGLDHREVPAALWAIFSCPKNSPEGIVQAEMYAFGDWLPRSGFRHAHAPEMEVYPASPLAAWEFWLPVVNGPG